MWSQVIVLDRDLGPHGKGRFGRWSLSHIANYGQMVTDSGMVAIDSL